jgi:hypothetical protein
MSNTSTLQGLKGAPAARRGRIWRRTALGVLLVIVGLSFFGAYGPSERDVKTVDGDYTLTMEYGSVVRSGQAVPMEIAITRTGGFDGPVTVVFDQVVFDHFDFQNWYPNPSTEIGEEDQVVYEFDPPEGDTLAISLDARVAPTQWGSRGEYSLFVDVDGTPTAATNYVVWVIP